MTQMYCSCHTHTEYSLIDGLCRVDDLTKAAKNFGMPALAITDHGELGGAIKFYQSCKKQGIKPIIGCLLKGQEIITDKGLKPVEEIQAGDMVLTHKGRFRPVVRVFSRRYSGTVYSLQMAGSSRRQLRLTSEHPVLIREFGKSIPDWIQPPNIKVGRPGKKGGIKHWNSYVCFPKLNVDENVYSISIDSYLKPYFTRFDNDLVKSEKNNKFDHYHRWENFPSIFPLTIESARLLGFFVSEGSLGHDKNGLTGQVTFTFSITEKDYAAECAETIANIFGLSATCYERPNKSICELVVNCLPLAYFLSRICGCGSENKRFPTEIFYATSDLREAFLTASLLGDGKNPLANSNHSRQSTLHVKSSAFAWGAKVLLASLGHWATVGITNKGHYTLPCSLYRKYSRTLEDENYIYKPISKISSTYEETMVYNFEVEEDNSYVSDFILHNCEMYITNNSLLKHKDQPNYHLLVLAKNDIGYKNLKILSTMSWEDARFYRKPRVDFDMLDKYGDGLIISSACLLGEIARSIVHGGDQGYQEAKFIASKYRERWKDDYYLELMFHGFARNGKIFQGRQATLVNEQQMAYQKTAQLAQELGIPTIITNDVHYICQGDAGVRGIKKNMQFNRKNHEKDEAEDNDDDADFEEYYLKSPEEMYQTFAGMEGSLERTLEIADKCNLYIPLGSEAGVRLPDFPIPADIHFEQFKQMWHEHIYHLDENGKYLTYKSWMGLQKRGLHTNPVYVDRLSYELAVVTKTEYAKYFIIVADYIDHAWKNNIFVGPGRGSGAGSLMCYCMYITNIDPIKYGLSFERFLAAEMGYVIEERDFI